jgi:hypothetical protein
MAWRVDKNPIEYLEQRVRYYQKKKKLFLKFLKDEDMLNRFGEEKITEAIGLVDVRISEFEYAVSILKAVDKDWS